MNDRTIDLLKRHSKPINYHAWMDLSEEMEAESEKLRAELRRMLLWHDAVRREFGIVPSPYHIAETREAAEAAGGE